MPIVTYAYWYQKVYFALEVKKISLDYSYQYCLFSFSFWSISSKFAEDMIFKVTLPKSFQGIKFQLGC